MTPFSPPTFTGSIDPAAGVLAVTDTTAIGFYLAYAGIAVTLVIWLARTLFRNGSVFLEDVFENDRVAESINHLLVVGFYLLNLGYALLLYQVDSELDLGDAFNQLVARIGLLLLSLGAVHLLNMFVFWRIRNHRGRGRKYPSPRPIVPAQNTAGTQHTAGTQSGPGAHYAPAMATQAPAGAMPPAPYPATGPDMPPPPSGNATVG